MIGTSPGRSGGGSPRATVFRWECRCQERPILLATYDAGGRINIKVRDRYWHIQGTVQAVCPRCGAEHVLDLRGVDPAHVVEAADGAETSGRRHAPTGAPD